MKKYIRGEAVYPKDIPETIAILKTLYDNSIFQLKSHFSSRKAPPSTYPSYPFLGITIKKSNQINRADSYIGAFQEGFYGTTLTHIALFEEYLIEQLENLQYYHDIEFVVGESFDLIPLPYAISNIANVEDEIIYANLMSKYCMPNLKRINDDIPNGTYRHALKPLSLFTAERTDFSMHRLEHYTATSIDHFQHFILFTNYQRYVDGFLEYGVKDTEKTEFIGPENRVIDQDYIKESPKIHAQMPAYHLKYGDKTGITLINIGVGPSNAKNITDHLAVLRPHCWLMLGHCAGLRQNQILGDYVLAHAYVREDHVLDDDLPAWVPIPALAEVQQALERATAAVVSDEDIKTCLRTGTILSTDDRNWELKTHSIYERFQKARVIAVDMESATIAANGFRLRIPYGTLLCVSDKPIHGELKLRGMAESFYRKRINQHLEIGLETVKYLRQSEKLHSRKLRGFDETPFR